MTKLLFVHRHNAFTSKAKLLEYEDVTPEEADSAHFSYSGKTPAILWRVDGPQVNLITDNMEEALAEARKRGVGYILTQINVWSDACPGYNFDDPVFDAFVAAASEPDYLQT